MTSVEFDLELDTETVMDCGPVPPFCLEATATLREVLDQLKDDPTGSVLICGDGALEGIFTERDALRLMAQGAELDLDQPIESFMIRDVVSIRPGDSVAAAIEKMSVGGYRHLPIVDDRNRPVGVISVAGILHFMVEHFPKVIYTLPPQPHHRTNEREGA